MDYFKIKPVVTGILITATVFVIDIFTSADIAVWLGYLLVLPLAAPALKRKQVLQLAGFFTILISLGFAWSPSSLGTPTAVVNRALGASAVWIIAFLIARHKRSDEALREMDEKFKTIVDESPAGAFLVQDGRFVYFNPMLAAFLGYGPEELKEKGVLDLAAPEELESSRKLLEKINRGEIPRLQLERKGVRKDGSVMHAEIVGSATVYKGRPAFMGMVQDITSRKQAEDRFRQAFEREQAARAEAEEGRKLLEAVMENIPEGVAVADAPDGKFRMVNREAGKIVAGEEDTTVEEFASKWEVYCPKTKRLLLSEELPLMRAVKNGEKVNNQEVLIKNHRGEKTLLCNASPVMDEYGNVAGGIIAFRDITDKKELERAREDFLAMVTHDLKSPLTAMLGYADLLMMLEKDSEKVSMLDAIKQGGKRVMRMVEDFMTLSRLESGKMEITPVPDSLSAVLNSLQKDFLPLARKKGVSLNVQVPPLPTAYIDRKLVERSVSNLLQNAITYTPVGGEVTLTAESGRRERGGKRRDGGFFAISVRDTGPGISEEEAGRVFEKYYRSSRTKGKGSGLGLAIVKAVAEAHGGRAAVRSGPEKGSTFSMYLPARRGAGA